MIRYRTRDLTRLLPGTGRAMRRLDKITCRSDDMLIIRGVNVFPTQIEEQLLKQALLSPIYELHIHRSSNLDSLQVHVELRPEHAELSEPERDALCREFRSQIKVHVGISTQIKLHPYYTLKRSEGKACHVFDQRGEY